jgi:phosphoribosylanthranilate isomerase
MHIKICGLTNLDDTLAAVDAGADYLGFNFYSQSPRCVTPDACARLQSALVRRDLPVKTVGIFVNHTPAEVAALLDDCGLDLAQLHGDERPEHLTLLWGRAFKAVRQINGLDAADDLDALTRFSPGQPAFLVDAHSPNVYGGTGQTADWSAASRLAARYPIFLAGGLTPANVGAAIDQVRPWGVDVASGVEASHGKKDHDKMRAFVKAIHAVGETRAAGTGTSREMSSRV